jgi:subtilisin family serine protease
MRRVTHTKILGGSMKNTPIALLCVAAMSCAVGTAFAAEPVSKRLFTTDELRNLSIPGMSAGAQQRALESIGKMRAAKLARAGSPSKVSGMLKAFAEQADGNDQAQHPLMTIAKSQVMLKLKLATADPASVAALQAAGLHVTSANEETGSVYASCPVGGLHNALPGLTAMANIQRIEPMLGALRRTGSVLSEGDAALRADVARQQFGVDGSGVKVCVISDGVDGAAESAATGNLPANDLGEPLVDVCPLNDNTGAEGTAMLEIIHDLAPGASLGFCPAFGENGEQGLADSITYLSEIANCDVIVDDVAFLTEPYFEDGPVAKAVDAAFVNGAIYFSSAGNGALDHYETPFRDVSPGTDIAAPFVNLHDFGVAAGGPSDVDWAGLVASGGNFFAAFLQWNDRFGKSRNDYDIYLFDRLGFLAGEADPDPTDDIEPIFPLGGNGIELQDGDDDPLEIAFVVNNQDLTDPFGAIEQFFIVIDRFSGREKLLEINFNGFFSVNSPEDFSIARGSVWGHAAARGAISVAATGAVVNQGDEPNPMLDIIEPFSSRGPSRIFFTRQGKVVDEARLTPTLTATDGVSVTGFGGFPTTFFGTSASAPHAAAVAALILDARPGLPNWAVRLTLRRTALDRGRRGFDATWGKGLIDAVRALEFEPPEERPWQQEEDEHPQAPAP